MFAPDPNSLQYLEYLASGDHLRPEANRGDPFNCDPHRLHECDESDNCGCSFIQPNYTTANQTPSAMEVIEIHFPPDLSGDFYCPLSGEPAVDENGTLAVSCVAYIPPLAFHDAIISCPHFESYWESILSIADIDALQGNITGEAILGFLEAYEGPPDQKLIGFRVETTTTLPRFAPEFLDPIYTLPFFYIINFGCELPRTPEHQN